MPFCIWAQGNQLKFIENKNQWADDIDYFAQVPGGSVFVKATGFEVYLVDEAAMEQYHENSHLSIDESGTAADECLRGHYFTINFENANPNAVPVAGGRSKEYYNYFLGSDPGRWGTDAFGYNQITYPEIYDGIDLLISSSGSDLKYDFVVHANTDPSQIKITYSGLDGLDLMGRDLVHRTSVGELIEKIPYAYQIIDGARKYLSARFRKEENTIVFEFPEGYDPCFDLVIDPLLIFSTYSGSTADNWGSTATPGEHGTLYSSGITNHLNAGGTFPATPGAFQTTYGGVYDLAIIKYDSTGSQMLYASYLGGANNDSPHSLVVDKDNNLLVLGTTSSPNFPTVSGSHDVTFNGGNTTTALFEYAGGSDIVVSKISQHGNQLIGSTFIGGTSNDGINPTGGALQRNYGDQMRGDIITDEEGNVYISSVTSSSNFPVMNSFGLVYGGGVTDAVIVKLLPDLSDIVWSGFLGGNNVDASHSIKFDSLGNLYTAGGTASSNFPATSGAYQETLKGDVDGWIAHLAGDGSSILQATFTGTTNYDQVYFVDLNADGEVYVYGQTNGAMPITAGTYNNPNSGQFVQKFDSELSSLIFSTVFGSGLGQPNISPTAFLVNECNNLYMSGWGGIVNGVTGGWQTSTFGMPTTPDALQTTTSGSDFYFIVLTDDATQLLYATFLGGASSRTHVDGGTSRFDKGGIVYHAVCSGCRAYNATGGPTSDFPTTQGAWSRTNNSGNCNNAAFKFDLSSLRARINTNNLSFTTPGIDEICFPDSIVFLNNSTGGEIFEWDLGDGTLITKVDASSIIHQYQQEGQYLVKLKAIDQNTCIGVDSVAKLITIFQNKMFVQDDDVMCQGDTYELKSSGGVSYLWQELEGEFASTVASPSVEPDKSTSYAFTAFDSNGCIKEDTVTLEVIPSVDVRMRLTLLTDCWSRPSVVVQNVSPEIGMKEFYFDFGDGTKSDEERVNHSFAADGDYDIKLVGINEFCVYEDLRPIPIYDLKVPNLITPDGTKGFNDRFTIQFGEEGRSPSDAGLHVQLKIFDRWGKKVYEADSYQNDWMASDVEAGVYYYEATLKDYTVCKGWVHVVK